MTRPSDRDTRDRTRRSGPADSPAPSDGPRPAPSGEHPAGADEGRLPTIPEDHLEGPTPGPDLASDQLEASSSSASVRTLVGRAGLIILAATLFGRILGLVRDQVVAYHFGAGALTDAFFLAYKVPYLLSLTIGGALTATFIPVFTQRLVTGRRDEAWELSVKMMNAVAVLLLGLTALLVLAAPWIMPLVGFGFPEDTADTAVYLFRILMPSVIFASMAGLAIGILNSLKRFSLPAFSTAAGSIMAIVFVLLFADVWGITSLAVGTTVGAFLSLLVLFPQMRSHGMRYFPRIDWRAPGMREVGMLIWPIIIGSGVGKVSIFFDQTLASTLPEGSVSALNYSEKLFQLPLGLFVAGITVPLFPLLSEQVAARQTERVKSTLNFALRLIAFIMIPATVGLIVLRQPIIALLLEHGRFVAADTDRTAFALLFYALGLFSFAGRDTLTRVFYAYHDTRTPVKISVLSVVLNVAVSVVLMQFLGVGGLALGTTIALTVNLLVLMELLRRKLGPMGFRSFGRSLILITGAAAFMGVGVWLLDWQVAANVSPGNLGLGLRVGSGIAAGGAIYLAVVSALRLPELGEVIDMLRSVVQRKRPAAEQEN
jgi:putative peptidoglycan lipid II flippase